MVLDLCLINDRAEASNRECQGTLGKEVDLAEIITSTNLIVNGRTENGLYPGGTQREKSVH